MPPSALQAPLRDQPTRALGRTLFRKQVLPADRSIVYKGRRIDFSRDYLRKLVDHFQSGSFDSVPFLLADWENRHTSDPDRVRGSVQGLELTSDGLDMIVALSDDGAKVVRDNPKLGVSARIVEEGHPEIECPRRVPAIEHVLGTIQPRVNGLRNWEPVSDLSSSYSPEQVIDLTAETYQEMPPTDGNTKLTDEQRTALKDAGVADDKLDAVAEIFAEGDGGGTEAKPAAETEPKPDEKKPGKIAQALAKLTGRDASEFDDGKIAEAIGAEAEPGEEKKEETEPVALSAEAQKAIDLAAADSSAAKTAADQANAELRELRFEHRKGELLSQGVPPAMVDLAAPVLKAEDDAVIELSAGEKTSPREIMDKLLDEAKGTVDLSAVIGSAVTDDDPQRAEAKDLAAKMEEAG